MKSTDLVNVVWVLPSNHICVTLTVAEASKHIRGWWLAREACKNGSLEEREKAFNWLEEGTFSLNTVTDDGVDIALAVVAWKHVQAIYFVDKSHNIQERLVKLMEQQTDYYGQGEQWKEGEGE